LEVSKHIGCIYKSSAEHQQFVTAYLTEGLKNNQKIVYIAHDVRPDAIRAYLHASGHDTRKLTESGQLKILTVQDVFVKEGKLTPETIGKLLKKESKKARTEGYALLRYCLEVSSILQKHYGTDEYEEYLSELHSFLDSDPSLVLFLYNHVQIESSAIFHILRSHPFLYFQNECSQNPFFLHQSVLISQNRSEETLNVFMNVLKESKEQEKKRKERDAFLSHFFSALDHPAILVNGGYRVLQVNQRAQQLLECNQDDAYGKRFCDLFEDPHTHQLCNSLIEKEFHSETDSVMFRWVSGSGKEIEVAWKVTPFRSSWDDQGLFLWVGTDRSPIRKAEKRQQEEYEALTNQHQNTLKEKEGLHHKELEAMEQEFQTRMYEMSQEYQETIDKLHKEREQAQQKEQETLKAREETIQSLQNQLISNQKSLESVAIRNEERLGEKERELDQLQRIVNGIKHPFSFFELDGVLGYANTAFYTYLEEHKESPDAFFQKQVLLNKEEAKSLSIEPIEPVRWNGQWIQWISQEIPDYGWIWEGVFVTSWNDRIEDAERARQWKMCEDQVLHALQFARSLSDLSRPLGFLAKKLGISKASLYHRATLFDPELLVAEWASEKDLRHLDLFEMRQQHVDEDHSLTEFRGFFSIPPGSIPLEEKEQIRAVLTLFHMHVVHLLREKELVHARRNIIHKLSINERLMAHLKAAGMLLGFRGEELEFDTAEQAGSSIIPAIVKAMAEKEELQTRLEDRKKDREKNRKRNPENGTISFLPSFPIHWYDNDFFFSDVINQIARIASFDAIRIWLRDETDSFRVVAEKGMGKSTLAHSRTLDFSDPLMGQVFQGLAPYSLQSLHSAHQSYPYLQAYFGLGFSQYSSFPIKNNSAIIGWVEVFNRHPWEDPIPILFFFQQIAYDIGLQMAIQKHENRFHKTRMKLELWVQEGMGGILRLMEEKGIESLGHLSRVEATVRDLAISLDYPAYRMDALMEGVMLHDVGMLAIDETIPRKKELLNPSERTVMETHVIRAKEILGGLNHLPGMLEIPTYHHERWNGSGYPEGRIKEEIPLSARIFAVADVFDALSSDRPYRKAWTKKAVREYLMEQRAILFDPDVIDVFLRSNLSIKELNR